MDETRPNIRRYRDRQAFEEVGAEVRGDALAVAILGAVVVSQAFAHSSEPWAVTLLAAAGCVLFVLAYGIWMAKEWARLALVSFDVAALAFNLVVLTGLTPFEVDRTEFLVCLLLGGGVLSLFAGAENRERFAAARRHRARSRSGVSSESTPDHLPE